MTSELLLYNLRETRRRSELLWNQLPESHFHWKPDSEAMSALEMIRHVVQADFGWNKIIKREDLSNYSTPWKDKPIESVQDELEFAKPYREEFIRTVESFSDAELNEIKVIHPGIKEEKLLGHYLLRIAYHESVHAGQFLSYLRSMGIDRPMIWD